MPHREGSMSREEPKEYSKEDCFRERDVERDEEGRLILYHATDARGFAGIEKDKRIRPRSETGNSLWGLEHEKLDKEKSSKVYLSCKKTAGDNAAILHNEKGGSYFILEVHAKEEDLRPDEDSQCNSWYESLGLLGNCSFDGAIPDYELSEGLPFQLPKSIKEDFFARACACEEGSPEEQKVYDEYAKLLEEKRKEEEEMMRAILEEDEDNSAAE